MREEMEKIRNEFLEDMKERKDFRRLSLELENAKLKQKEAEVALKEKSQQPDLLLKYKSELENKDREIQQMKKA